MSARESIGGAASIEKAVVSNSSGSSGAGATALTGAERHATLRVRHELRRRTLHVVSVSRLAPKMVRVTLGGAELEGFTSLGFDDHVKVFFPSEGSPDSPAMRDYTPRRFDAARLELDIDFVLHGDGPATTWAAQAAVGQQLVIGGPKGSFVVATDFDSYVLVGDESAWPATARRLAELPAGSRAFVVAEVDRPADEQSFESEADVHITWVHREGREAGADDGLQRAVAALALPAGDCFFWAAGESAAMRRLRPLFVERGAPKEWIKAAGYWKSGAIASHETIGE